MKIGKLARRLASQSSSSGGFYGNIVNNPNNEAFKEIELINWVV